MTESVSFPVEDEKLIHLSPSENVIQIMEIFLLLFLEVKNTGKEFSVYKMIINSFDLQINNLYF